MRVEPLQQHMIPELLQLMKLGTPYIRPRTYSDYWLYAQLFSSTCPVALVNDKIAGSVIAFRSQDNPDDIYVQDVITHPDQRRQGVARSLLDAVKKQGRGWGCLRLYLTSEPDNVAAHETWTTLGFDNVPGDQQIGDISVTTDYKGPGRSRAIYQLKL
jgi:Acetyltransferases